MWHLVLCKCLLPEEPNNKYNKPRGIEGNKVSFPIIGVHHIAIIVSDYEKSKHFYTKILGADIMQETYREKRNSYKLDLRFKDGTQLELFSFSNPPSRLTYPEACGLRHLAFQVQDIDSAIGFLNNYHIESEPIRIDPLTGRRFTFFKDPDNLPLELYEIE